MYGTNVLTAPRPAFGSVDGAHNADAAPSFRIRHSRPSAGYEVPTRSPKLRLTTRGRVVLSSLAALPVAIALFLMTLNGGGATATSNHATGDFDYVTVMAGQTMWQLALELDPTADPRDIIHDILNLNQLNNAQIYPGQRLAIPTAYTGP